MPYHAFTGPEELAKSDAMELKVNQWFGNTPLDEHNRLLFSGSEWNIEAFANSWEGFSLFAEKKILIIRHFEALSAKDTLNLLGVIKNDVPDNMLILESANWDARTQFVKWWSQQKLSVENFKQPYPNEIAGWIQTRAQKKYQRKIGPLEAHMLWDAIGDNLSEIDLELQKLNSYVSSGKAISAESIESLLAKHRNSSLFELQKAVGLKNKAQALQILDSLLNQGEPSFLVLGQTAKHLIKLAKVRAAGGRGPTALKLAGVPEFIFKKEKIEEQARSWDLSQVQKALSVLSFAEWQSKTGYIQFPFETNLIFSSIFET